MNGRRSLRLMLRAGIPGLLFAVAVSRDEAISIQLWGAAAVVWIAGVLLRDFLDASAVEPGRLEPLWRRRRRHPGPTYLPRGVRTASALLTDAQRNAQTHTNRLRPQLTDLARHFLPIRYGIDIDRQPERVTSLFGRVAWLLDPAIEERAPTSAELAEFLDIVLDDKGAGGA